MIGDMGGGGVGSWKLEKGLVLNIHGTRGIWGFTIQVFFNKSNTQTKKQTKYHTAPDHSQSNTH